MEERAFIQPQRKITEEMEPKKETVVATDPTKEHALRTYSSDMAKALKQNQGSVIKIAMAEQKRKNEANEMPVETKKKRGWIFAILLTLVLGFVALGVAWYFGSSRPIEVKKPISIQNSMIFVEREKVFEWYGTRGTVISNINQSKTEMLSYQGQMMNLFGVVAIESGTKEARFDDLSKVVGMGVSKSFSIDTVKDFMIGVDSNQTGSHMFMIIESASFDSLFSGMIAWERTMLRDIYEIYGIDKFIAERNFETQWVDKIIKNKDTRILYDSENNMILMYGYAENNVVVVTDNQETFDRVLSRLQDRVPK